VEACSAGGQMLDSLCMHLLGDGSGRTGFLGWFGLFRRTSLTEWVGEHARWFGHIF